VAIYEITKEDCRILDPCHSPNRGHVGHKTFKDFQFGLHFLDPDVEHVVGITPLNRLEQSGVGDCPF